MFFGNGRVSDEIGLRVADALFQEIWFALAALQHGGGGHDFEGAKKWKPFVGAIANLRSVAGVERKQAEARPRTEFEIGQFGFGVIGCFSQGARANGQGW